MPSSRPSLRLNGTTLERAFYASAQARGAEIYRNSFGSPYFFHRTRISLVHEKEAHWFNRVIGIRLVAEGEEALQRKDCLPMSAEAVPATGPCSSSAKELHKASYQFYDHLEGSRASHQFNWAEVEKYYVTNAEGEVVMVLHRYPVE